MIKKASDDPEGDGPAPKFAPYGPEELQELESLLLNRREFLMGNVQGLEDEAAQQGPEDRAGSPLHLADHATDSYSFDISLTFIENQSGRVRDIDEALERLRDGSYGRCELCDGVLSLERLRAAPDARLCVTCQTDQERAEEGR